MTIASFTGLRGRESGDKIDPQSFLFLHFMSFSEDQQHVFKELGDKKKKKKSCHLEFAKEGRRHLEWYTFANLKARTGIKINLLEF